MLCTWGVQGPGGVYASPARHGKHHEHWSMSLRHILETAHLQFYIEAQKEHLSEAQERESECNSAAVSLPAGPNPIFLFSARLAPPQLRGVSRAVLHVSKSGISEIHLVAQTPGDSSTNCPDWETITYDWWFYWCIKSFYCSFRSALGPLFLVVWSSALYR